MRRLPFSTLALAVFLFLPDLGTCQGPPDGQGRGRQGGGGRFSGGDPTQRFNQLANGKEVILRSELSDARMLWMFDSWAQQLGITNGRITRDQFTTLMNQRRVGRGGGAGGQAPSGSAPSGSEVAGADRISGRAESMFRRLDANGDGVLNNDEMPEALRAEREKWDADHNGLIDLNEFKAYFQARVEQFRADRQADPNQALPSGWFFPEGASPEPTPEPEERRPTVYRAGKLPKELPAWFSELDTDQDGQVGLYEWKAGGRSLDEFRQMDRNNDGFLTVEEVLHYIAHAKGNAAAPAPVAGNNDRSGGSLPARGGNASRADRRPGG